MEGSERRHSEAARHYEAPPPRDSDLEVLMREEGHSLQHLKDEDAADIAKRDQRKKEYKKVNSTIANVHCLIDKNQAAIDKLERLIEDEKAKTIEAIKEVEDFAARAESAKAMEGSERRHSEAARHDEAEAPPPRASDLEALMREEGHSLPLLKDIVRYAFTHFDGDGSGGIDEVEFAVACQMLSIDISDETRGKVFQALSKGKGEIFAEDVEGDFEGELKDRFFDHFTALYSESPLSKGQALLGRLWEAAMTPMPLEERARLVKQYLDGQGEAIAELLEFVVAAGLVLSKLQCLSECEDVDYTDLVPAAVVMGKSLKELSAFVGDRSTTDLKKEDAAIFATAFKPVGFTIEDFEKTTVNAGAKWVMIPAGSRVPAPVFLRTIGIIGRGRMQLQKPALAGASEAMSDTVCEFGIGSFLGTSQFIGGFGSGFSSANSLWGNGQTFVEVTEEVRMLCFDVAKLKEYLSHFEEADKKFQSAFARSVMRTMAVVAEQVAEFSRELPLFFRDTLRSMAAKYRSDRASLWIHDGKRRKLWTLFVSEDGSIAHYEMDDSNGLAGYSLLNREIVNIPDCYKDDRFNTEADRTTGYFTKNMLCAPLYDRKLGEEPIGVVQLINHVDGRGTLVPFTDAHVEEVKDHSWLASLMVRTLGCRYNSA